MLDVAIGLIVVFLLVSLVCSATAELIESVLKQRSSSLFRGLKELLQDQNATGLLKQFYEHPLIAGLYRDKFDATKPKNLPSYIPARTFALALIDIMQPTVDSDTARKEGDNDEVKKQKSSIEVVTRRLVAVAGADIKDVITEIEGWFNSSMDRISGWYKRKVQRILVVLGLFISVVMNVDTIAVFKSLTNDTDLRNSLVAAAQEYAKADAMKDENATPQQRLEQNSKKLRELRLPIGWDWQKPAELDKDPRYVSNYHLAMPAPGLNWGIKILGWLLTATAVSLGASFWFDALNKIMVIRATVKPREKSIEEGSEDRKNKGKK
jgi:hypothetical protein